MSGTSSSGCKCGWCDGNDPDPHCASGVRQCKCLAPECWECFPPESHDANPADDADAAKPADDAAKPADDAAKPAKPAEDAYAHHYNYCDSDEDFDPGAWERLEAAEFKEMERLEAAEFKEMERLEAKDAEERDNNCDTYDFDLDDRIAV
jgi:hypothetical protein